MELAERLAQLAFASLGSALLCLHLLICSTVLLYPPPSAALILHCIALHALLEFDLASGR
jgi:hypothetical protein